jgi:hypothetical protein
MSKHSHDRFDNDVSFNDIPVLDASSDTAEECRECEGHGVVGTECPTCHGTRIHKGQRCGPCRGRGFQTSVCPECGGDA